MTMIGRFTALLSAASLLLSACGGGGSAGGSTGGAPTPSSGAALYAVPAAEALSADEVGRIVAQAVGEAQARGLPSIISVVDRVGNVLAVYSMTGARGTAVVAAAPSGMNSDFQGLTIPATLAAIAKAITSAYLSSAGNAFDTRTASDIVQQNFPVSPQTSGLESGPLFGVQFSQLPCSDLNRRFGVDASTGPKRSPLGLAADLGSVPLYKNGVVVGGVGIMGDGAYGADDNAADVDQNDEEYIALAASRGFEAPATIRADRVSIDGTTLGFLDATPDNLKSNPASPPALAGTGAYIAVAGYYAGGPPISGTPYGSPASGYRAVTAAERSAGSVIDNPDAFILVDAVGNNRFPIRGGTDAAMVGTPLSAAEVKAVEEEAFKIMSRARGAIRQPQDSRMQATISIVDTNGAVLVIARAPDAPVFGTDVSLQKARTASFFSSPSAAGDLLANSSPDVQSFVAKTRAFLGDPNALTGRIAFAERPIGLLARPFFPDGQNGTPNGPLSRPIQDFNPFSTGLQSALIAGDVLANVANPAAPVGCTASPGPNRLRNGIQIFPGGVPIYRGNTLVGAIGVSGDGIDQDDMVSFLGLYNGGSRVGGTIGHAIPAMRISTMAIPSAKGGFLPYVQCPFAPFLDMSEQNVCENK